MAKKKIDLTAMKQTHGAVLTKTSILNSPLLNKGRYGTTDLMTYSKQLTEMSLADLQYHAINVAQIKPGFDRNRLIASLEKRFADYLFNEKLKANVPSATGL